MASTDQRIQAKLKDWLLNPEKFVREALSVTKISSQQRDGLESYRRILTAKLKRSQGVKLTAQEESDAKKIGISIMSGHNTGKTAFLSWIILHFILLRSYCKIPCVAPVGKQISTNLWPEIHLWLRKSEILNQYIQWQAEKVFFKEAGGKEWFAVPRTIATKASEEEQAETIAGINADNKMVIVDEASGVPDPVFRPLEGGLGRPVNFAVLTGNPTQATGYFIESHQKYREYWFCHQWNAEESELVERDQIERMAKKYGKDSNAYRIRVQGLPPLSSPDVLVPWDWVMRATTAEIFVEPDAPKVMGIDVGRELGGDESVVVVRQGNVVQNIHTFKGVNTQELAYWCLKEIQENEIACAAIDVIGWGAGTYDTLKDLAPCPVIPVNVAEKADDPDRFTRKRDEMWWRLRERFQSNTIKIPYDDVLIGEISTIKYNFSKIAKEKIKIESKQELRDRGLESPNRADALILSEEAIRYVSPSRSRYDVRNWRQERPAAWVG